MASFGKKERFMVMLVMTSLLFLAEIITGYVTNSMALVAESFHMLSDVISIIIGYSAVHYSDKKSKRNTYDWARAEVLGAMANAVFLLSLVLTIVVSAVQRLIVVERITRPLLILGVGLASLVISIIGLVLFGQHAHGHHFHGRHHHGNQHSKDTQEYRSIYDDDQEVDGKHSKTTRQSSQLNMQAVFLHVIGDALGSIVVIISALVINFAEDDWKYYVDPVMSLAASVIISCTTIPLLKRASLILLQNPPNGVDVEAIKLEVSQVPDVINIHDLHVWQLSARCAIATVHVVLYAGSDFTQVSKKLKKIFHKADIHSTTIQPEFLFGMKSLSPNECPPIRRTSCAFDDELHGCTSETNLNTPVQSSSLEDECLLQCLSDECFSRMCCDEVKRRNWVSNTEQLGSSTYNSGYVGEDRQRNLLVLEEKADT